MFRFESIRFSPEVLAERRGVIQHQRDAAESLRGCCEMCGEMDSSEGGNVRLRACDACDAVRYCDRECQRADWQAHQLACKILATDREILVRVGVSGSRIVQVHAPVRVSKDGNVPPPFSPSPHVGIPGGFVTVSFCVGQVLNTISTPSSLPKKTPRLFPGRSPLPRRGAAAPERGPAVKPAASAAPLPPCPKTSPSSSRGCACERIRDPTSA